MASFTCPPGSICPPSASEPVGANKTRIFYSTATTVTQGSDGKVNGAERVLYIDKNGSYQPAAISKDRGKTYQFSDPKYPLMVGVAGADLQKDLNNPASGIHKNVDAGIAKHLPKAGILPTQQQVVVAATANQATGAGSTSGGSGGVSDAEFKAGISDSKKTRNQFPTLKYPETLDAGKQDVIKFSMLKYSPKAFQTTKDNLGGFADRPSIGKDRNAIGVVTLPIPNGISDSNTLNWGDNTMNAAEALAANVALSGIRGGGAAAANTAGQALEAVPPNSGELQTGMASLFAGLAANGNAASILQRTEGAVINPNLELLFNAPTLRPFNFTFKLASRSETESKIIRSIIRFFKQGSAAQKSESNLFLKAPHTFQIQYLHRGEEHKFLNKFKECALQSFSVNYTPEGQYATFNDGAMVSYQITMQFQELEPIFNEDYTNDGTNPSLEIGF
jgi:hypothetical protein